MEFVQCITEALEELSLAELPKRTDALHGLMDVQVRLTCEKN